MIKKILITGSHGFIGAALADTLYRKRIAYSIYDRLHPEQLELDFDAVVHCGGITPFSDPNGNGRRTTKDYFEANVQGMRVLLDVISKNKRLKKIINIGSAAEYGVSSSVSQEGDQELPVSDYGFSKVEQSSLVEDFARTHGIQTINLRLFNVLGCRTRWAGRVKEIERMSIAENLMKQFMIDFKGTIAISNKNSVRDFVDIDDVVDAILLALDTKKGGVYELVNICSGVETKLADLVQLFASALHKTYRIKETNRTKDASTGVNEKAKKLLGWMPKVSLHESVQKMIGKRKKILIVGAGVAGHMLVKQISKESRFDITIVGLVDDDEKKQKLKINGARVLGKIRDLPTIIKEIKVDQILISTPSVDRKILQQVAAVVPHGFPVKVLPSISSVILGKVELSNIRDIAPSDLIGRPLIKSDQQHISERAKNKTFLVTGGAGSIGSEIVRQLYFSKARKVIVADAWEEGVFNIREEFNKDGNSKVLALVANIRDKERMEEIVGMFKVDAIVHAAAYKHVPLMEDHPSEAHKTNFIGTKNLLEIAVQYKVKDFVMISTDKAVNPINVMGKSKRAAELLVKEYAKKHAKVRFCAVRFGNVLHSSGSVMPKFLRQIQRREPVTITDMRMTRYFMSIPEAVSLVLQSWIFAKNGQILVLDMGAPVKIIDLAINLIKLHGLEPYVDIPIKETGIRPGEKLHEKLFYATGVLKQIPGHRIFIAEELDS